jgi:hypothetical protein
MCAVQRKWEKSLGVEVKPYVKPPYRNSNTRKTIRKVDVDSCCVLQWREFENNWNISRIFSFRKFCTFQYPYYVFYMSVFCIF